MLITTKGVIQAGGNIITTGGFNQILPPPPPPSGIYVSDTGSGIEYVSCIQPIQINVTDTVSFTDEQVLVKQFDRTFNDYGTTADSVGITILISVDDLAQGIETTTQIDVIRCNDTCSGIDTLSGIDIAPTISGEDYGYFKSDSVITYTGYGTTDSGTCGLETVSITTMVSVFDTASGIVSTDVEANTVAKLNQEARGRDSVTTIRLIVVCDNAPECFV